MIVGDTDLSMALVVLLTGLVVSLCLNKLLFYMNHSNYSIKYSIMKDRKFFRVHHLMCGFVEMVYKLFFVLPFVFLLSIAIVWGMANILDFLPILINGGIVLLILYPTKQSFYYVKQVVLWLLVVVSQFVTLFLFFDKSNSDFYTLMSSIFYPINSILFSLAILAKQKNYWEIQQAISLCEDQVRKIHPEWVQYDIVQAQQPEEDIQQKYRKKQKKKDIKSIRQYKNISYLFGGGIFGNLCKNYRNWKFGLLYFLSLCMLGVNALIIWKTDSSVLGLIGLITNVVFDIFIFAFNNIETQQRSIRNVMLLIFVGRILSFVFGKELWIFGYCALYFIIGIFIGRIIINKHLPMKSEKNLKKESTMLDALKTPEFVIFILTAEIIILVICSNFGIVPNVSVSYNNVKIQLWQFALIVIIATWIVILYLASIRMIQRHFNNIKSLVQYYFLFKKIQEHHVYIFVTYVFIVGLGVYCYLFLNNSILFFSCLFIPLILEILKQIFNEWSNNYYRLLADINEYNLKIEKTIKIIEKKENALKNQKKMKFSKNADTTGVLNSELYPQKYIKNTHLCLLRTFKHQEQKSQSGQYSQNQFEQQIDNLEEKRQKLKVLQDWRAYQGAMPLSNIWKCMTPSDHWIIFLIPSLILLFCGFITCSTLISNSFFGPFFVICLASYLTLTPYLKVIRSLVQISQFEYFFLFVGPLVGIVVWSILHQYIVYALIWAGVYIILLAALISLGVGKIGINLIYLMIVKIAMLLLFVCIFLGFTIPILQAIAISWLIIIVCVGAIPVAYQNIEGNVPKAVIIICSIFIVGSIAAISIIAFVLNFASHFAIFSFVCFCIFFVFLILTFSIFYQRQMNKYACPHVYSAFGEPIYKFDSASETLKPSMDHKYFFDFALVTLIIYAAIVSVIFESKDFAIYALSIYASLNFFLTVLFSIKSYHELGDQKQKLTPEIIKAALNDLIHKYMIDCKDNRFSQQVYIEKEKKKQEAQKLQDENQLNQKWLEVVKLNDQYVKNQAEENKFFYFWIVLIDFHFYATKKKYMIDLTNQVKQIQSSLIQYGIFFESVSLALDFQKKYDLLMTQIESLNPYDYVNFEQILRQHQEKIKNMRKAQETECLKNNIEQEKRQHEMYEKFKEEISKSGNQKIKQFNELVKSLGKKGLYTDQQFPANQNSLGDLSSIVEQWRRPKLGQMLVKGGFSPYDVKQGLMGDCYLISSFGVLGQKWIRPAFGIDENGTEIWSNNKGAYMVRFYKFCKEVYVIIDDFLPINNHDEFVFAKSEDLCEIWPCILEKAYAKLYSGYHNIVEGKCHRVFAEFTGGFPFEILLDNYKANPNGLWTKIINSLKNRYLLAAGSPSNPLGDYVTSGRGIVQGHAYSILDARQIQDHKLIKLKNPHGSGGLEWNGDFSDESQFMTARMMKLLDHGKADDGIFWMKIQDFIHEYKSLYVCAVFDDKWLKVPPINGQFTEKNSFGTPNLSNQTFRNPQYGINAIKKCTLFVNLIQQSKSALQGTNYIYLRIQKNQGKRISKENISSDKLVGTALRPTNSVSISTEVVLEAQSYPYMFTLYISCKNQGDMGKYTIQMYSDDKNTTIIDDTLFDHANF